MQHSLWRVLVLAVIVTGVAGCHDRGAAEPFGKTFYVGGASNIDLLGSGVPDGMRQAGYRGDVQNFIWTMSFNPLIDQLVTVNAKGRAQLLTDEIERYHKRYPDNEVNIIALSAGTGVAVWAIENLKQANVANLVLLGSSLSHDYDVSRAMRHIDGKIYVYYSSSDMVLEGVRVVGTIDGKRGVDSVGQVGLRKPPDAGDRIVNTGWSRQYLRYGWAGGHTDCINANFIRFVVAPKIIPAPQATRVAARPARDPATEAALRRPSRVSPGR
jgi:hypothetical protein